MGAMQNYIDERLAKRAQVRVEIGEFVLTLDPTWPLFNVTHKRGEPIPKGLMGQWKQPWMFREAAEKLLGPSYSLKELAKQKQDYASAARSAGIDPATIQLENPNGGRRA